MKILLTFKKILSLLLIFIALLSFNSSIAQNNRGSIKGKIIDKTNGEALVFAFISLSQNGKILFSTQTDFEGKYNLDSIQPGNYEVAITYVGYTLSKTTNIKITANNITYVSIALERAAFAIEAYEIVEYEVPLISKDEPTISVKHISNMPGRTSYQEKRNNKYKLSKSVANYQIEEFNTEAYAYQQENIFKNANSTPLSTFSIDVDAASYSNMRRFINNGNNPPIDAVRVEEMINYFNYDYPQPQGEDPFSITTEMSDCPWNKKHKLVHIGIQGKSINIDELPASNLVFLLDVSGSMNNANKLPLLKKSFGLLVQNLTEKDRVAIVVYAGAAGVVLPSTPGNQKEKIMNALNRLNAGGSTAGGAGIKLAYKIALENFIKEGNNRVILATDGDFNIGASSDGEMTRLIIEKRESNVFLTCLGFGMGNYKDSKMEMLADKGNGNYAYIDNIMEAKKVLVTEMGATMHTIAKDVKIQVEFNPDQVLSYKLIGYENRLLNDEDFNDDTKDAGELGSGHTVTALYEVVLKKGSNNIPSIDKLRYQTVEPSGIYKELLTVKFRFKAPQGKKSKLIVKHLMNKFVPLAKSSQNFKFSAAVAEFGLLLKNSNSKGQASYEQVIKLAKSSKGNDDFGYRAEFIRLVEMSQMQESAFLNE